MAPGLPRKTLEDGTRSQVAVVPFYDRSGLIYETLETYGGKHDDVAILAQNLFLHFYTNTYCRADTEAVKQ